MLFQSTWYGRSVAAEGVPVSVSLMTPASQPSGVTDVKLTWMVLDSRDLVATSNEEIR